ncbi:hypothetical protein BDV95DRAFT_318390 [Massariosphaeria phaeospora]|uniref:Transmembrane protein n=1 Tax=Massariosphaeria phaeospora TaxID=100035 RepID=A0A7C8IGZ2_9PLEO|nr:hypothetical protein BDV95DRAFT_318390 [Massariosphaeria phaeospora]
MTITPPTTLAETYCANCKSTLVDDVDTEVKTPRPTTFQDYYRRNYGSLTDMLTDMLTEMLTATRVEMCSAIAVLVYLVLCTTAYKIVEEAEDKSPLIFFWLFFIPLGLIRLAVAVKIWAYQLGNVWRGGALVAALYALGFCGCYLIVTVDPVAFLMSFTFGLPVSIGMFSAITGMLMEF